MKLNREKLIQILTLVKVGLSNKDIMEQASCFIFRDNQVSSFNDLISVSHPLETPLHGAVPADELLKLLSKLKGEEIELTQTENEILISSGRSKAGLTINQEIALPIVPIDKINNWEKLPTNFCKCIQFTMRVCSKDMSRPVLTAISINKDGSVVGSDGFRILKALTNTEMPLNDFLLPATAASDIIQLDPIQIAGGNEWIHFKNKEAVVISCRIFEEKYPDVSKHLKVTGISVQFPKTLLASLEKAAIFSKRDHFLDESIDVNITNNRITIRGESGMGWFEEEANIRYSGNLLNFRITPYLLQDILKETLICIIGENLLKFETEEWQYVALIKH